MCHVCLKNMNVSCVINVLSEFKVYDCAMCVNVQCVVTEYECAVSF